MMMDSPGDSLSLDDAVKAFRSLPAQVQLASLHPGLAEADAKRDRSLQTVHWRFQAGGRLLLHSFQLGTNPGLAVKDVQSAYGYGGPLSDTEDSDFLRMADEAFVAWAAKSSVVAEFVRLHPLANQPRWYAGQVARNRETVYVDLTRDLFEQYENRRRTDVRRFADSGLSAERVSPLEMARAFPALYGENMARIGAADEYYFSSEYFEALFQFEEAESWLVSLDKKTAVAGAVILASPNAKLAEYHLGATAPGFERHKAASGLLHAAAAHYQSMGYRHFYLGGGRTVAADDTLLFFKKGFSSLTAPFCIGSRILDRPEYEKLRARFPDRAANGRVLFYKAGGAAIGLGGRR